MKNYTLLFHLLLASATLLSMDISVYNSFEHVSSELIGYMMQLSHNQSKISSSDIVKLVYQRRVNKLFQKAIDNSAVWRHIFSHLHNKDNAIFLISHGSLDPQSSMGKIFYSFLTSPAYYDCIFHNDSSELNNICTSNDRTGLLKTERLVPLIKACCVENVTIDQLLSGRENNASVSVNDFVKCMQHSLENLDSESYWYSKHADIQWKDIRGDVLLIHFALTYYLQHGSSEKNIKKFAQSDLIKACRCNDSELVQKLLEDNKHSSSQKNDPGLNALAISIINHNKELFNILLGAVSITYEESKKLIQLSACLNNNYTFEKLLNIFLSKESLDRSKEAFLYNTMNYVLALPSDNITILDTLHTWCTRCAVDYKFTNLSCDLMLKFGEVKKASYIKNHINNK